MASKKTIVITGATSGIGLALARQLAARPDVRVLLGARDAGRGEAALAELLCRLPGAAAELLPLDVASEASVRRAAALAARHAPLYAVVSNAGLWSEQPAATLEVNARGVRRVAEAFLPLLQRPGGRLIATGSGAASSYVAGKVAGCVPPDERQQLLANPQVEWEQLSSLLDRELAGNFGTDEQKERAYGAYGCSKAVMTAYHFILSRENPDLVVSTASPGFIQTKMTEGMGAKLTPEEGTKSLTKLLFEDLGERAWIYYGSDGLKSPLTWMRNPGEPEYEPGEWWN